MVSLAFTPRKYRASLGPIMSSPRRSRSRMRCCVSRFSLLLYTGQREGDVIRMKRDEIRRLDDGTDEIFVIQQKTGTKVWIPLHRDLKTLLAQTPRVSDFILNSSWGRPFS